MKKPMNTKETYNAIKEMKMRSKWNQGVKAFALHLLNHLEDDEQPTEKRLLNGADNWKQLGKRGFPYVSDLDIAKALATPTELKRTKGGEKDPNKTETWLDVQGRALEQAYMLIKSVRGE